MQVISASYRTDIPAFYGEWFIRRVREGYVRYKNPYGSQVISASLRPEDVHAVVFWSKNYRPFMKYLDEVERAGLDFYFHYTITGLPPVLEGHVPDWRNTVKNFRMLAERYTPDHVQWRYDPIVFSNITDIEFHERTFARLAQSLENATRRCYVSFVDLYPKVVRRLGSLMSELAIHDPPNQMKLSLALRLAETAAKHGITLYTCAEDFAAVGPIKHGACVDKEILDQLWPHKKRAMKMSSARGGCGCFENRDIGAYDTCPHGCAYCYAVSNHAQALEAFRNHQPDRDCLLDVGPNVAPSRDARDIPIQPRLL